MAKLLPNFYEKVTKVEFSCMKEQNLSYHSWKKNKIKFTNLCLRIYVIENYINKFLTWNFFLLNANTQF